MASTLLTDLTLFASSKLARAAAESVAIFNSIYCTLINYVIIITMIDKYTIDDNYDLTSDNDLFVAHSGHSHLHRFQLWL